MLHQAIQNLYSNVAVIQGNSVDDVVVLDNNGDTISINSSDVQTEVDRLTSEHPMNELREVRNAKLAETDWVVTMHKELGTNIPAAWKTYRQALRDITDTYTSLDDVVWPEKP